MRTNERGLVVLEIAGGNPTISTKEEAQAFAEWIGNQLPAIPKRRKDQPSPVSTAQDGN